MRILPREPRETGRDYALRNLKENIIQLRLAPGSMVSENELAQQMGLSRTPVREALLELSKVKLVEVYPQRGSAVALIDYDLVEEARFMRGALECAVVQLACRLATAQDVALLRANVDDQQRLLERSDADGLWTLDNAFHRLLFTIARKEHTHGLIKGFTLHFDRVRTMSLAAVSMQRNVSDHRAICEAVAAGNAAAARELTEMHLSRYKVDEEALRSRYPAAYFKQRSSL